MQQGRLSRGHSTIILGIGRDSRVKKNTKYRQRKGKRSRVNLAGGHSRIILGIGRDSRARSTA